jgi:hypothetical protein
MRFHGGCSAQEICKQGGALTHPATEVLDLAEVLSSRMRLRTEGRMWMGAHMRRTDCKYHQSEQPLSRYLKKQSYESVDDGSESCGPRPPCEGAPAERPLRPGRPSRPRQLDDVGYRGRPALIRSRHIAAPARRGPLFRRDGRTRPGRTAHDRRRRRGLHVRPTHDGGPSRVWLAADDLGRDGLGRAAGARPQRFLLRIRPELVRGRGREYAREPRRRPTDHASGMIDQ